MSVRAAERVEADAFERWEPHIRSFVCLCEPGSEPPSGPLSGLTVGVKDIIDVAGVPTRNGSAAFADAPPAAGDAATVAALRASGARIVGKTVTTEFAFTDPTDCRNPHDVMRSPGGSSSGSGAAVAAGLVDLALGTQTAGSLCRPAAYCGVVGLKPTYGVLPSDGVTPLARSFDSVGVIARSVDVARAAYRAMNNGAAVSGGGAKSAIRWLMPGEFRPAQDMAEALDAATGELSNICRMAEGPQLPIDSKAIVEAHRTVMLAEAAEAHGYLLSAETADLLRPKFRTGLETGLRLDERQIAAARRCLGDAAKAFWNAVDDVDIILTLPVPEAAPLLGESTGFQNWLTVWTVFGGPLVSLPWGVDSLGRPRAVMLAGKPGTDLGILNVAEKLERVAPVIPAPVPPVT